MRCVYVVRIEVDAAISESYLAWLKPHITEVVQAGGFTHAEFYEPEEVASDRRVFVVHYHARSRKELELYLARSAPKLRADADRRFGGRFQGTRQILNFRSEVRHLTEGRGRTQIDANERKDGSMTTQVNWQKIRSEFQRLTDVEELKSEVQRIGNELRKFDYHSVLSPKAQAKVKVFERRYAEVMRSLQQAQRQVDREVNRILRQIKVHRTDVTKVVAQQKDKLEKVSSQFKKRFTKKAAHAKRATVAKKRKPTARKRRKA